MNRNQLHTYLHVIFIWFFLFYYEIISRRNLQINIRMVILIYVLDWFVFWTLLKVRFIWNMNKLIGKIWNNDMDEQKKQFMKDNICSECGKIFLSFFFYLFFQIFNFVITSLTFGSFVSILCFNIEMIVFKDISKLHMNRNLLHSYILFSFRFSLLFWNNFKKKSLQINMRIVILISDLKRFVFQALWRVWKVSFSWSMINLASLLFNGIFLNYVTVLLNLG